MKSDLSEDWSREVIMSSITHFPAPFPHLIGDVWLLDTLPYRHSRSDGLWHVPNSLDITCPSTPSLLLREAHG